MARVLCARFEHLGLLAAWHRHPELRPEAVVVQGVAQEGGRSEAPSLRRPVTAASAAARAAGVRPGQSLRQAQQLCPAAVVVGFDVEAVERLRTAALAELCAVVPSVEMGDEHAYADLTGRHAQHPGEAAWAAAAARALTRGLGGEPPAVGVAGSRFTAWMAARVSTPRRVRRVRPGEEPDFLAPLPTGLLPVDAAVLARLGALGLDCLGAVAALSPADLHRQFGGEGLAVHRFARGEDEAPVTPATAPRTLVERLTVEGGIPDRELLHRCAEHLCGALGDRLRERGLSAGRAGLVLEGEGGTVAAATRVPPAPAGSAADLWPTVLGLLGAAEPAGPVVGLRLEVGALGITSGRQVELWRRGDAERDAVVRAVARLHDRFGAAAVLRPRLALDPGDLPERRFAWEPAAPGAREDAGAWELPARGPVDPARVPAPWPAPDRREGLVILPAADAGRRR
jgi:nucleotidyltransferase/DNA polymerase involved in DNA repair